MKIVKWDNGRGLVNVPLVCVVFLQFLLVLTIFIITLRFALGINNGLYYYGFLALNGIHYYLINVICTFTN